MIFLTVGDGALIARIGEEESRLAGSALSDVELAHAREFFAEARRRIDRAIGRTAEIQVMRSSSVDFPHEYGIEDGERLEEFIEKMLEPLAPATPVLDALRVLVLDPKIIAAIEAVDPMAAKQARKALEVKP